VLNLEMVGEGATTKVYRDGNKSIKLYAHASMSEVENEAKLQAFAVKAGLPVPAVFGVRQLDDDMTALDMAYIPGAPLLHGRMDRDKRYEAIRTLVKLQSMVHAIETDQLPKQADRLAWKISQNQDIGLPIKDALLFCLRNLDRGCHRLCHGDFHPLNILHDGDKHWVIDWVDATSGDPMADACRTFLIFKQYITRSAGIFLRLFCEESGASQADILAWLPVIAAARLSEPMDDKARTMAWTMIDAWMSSGYMPPEPV